MKPIIVITTHEAWENAQSSGQFTSDTLQTEGFIHCSTLTQVVAVANARFTGRRDLLLLVIDTSQVQSTIRFEVASNGEFYPHIYGPLNTDAVMAIVPFLPQPDGTFRLPDLDNGN